MEPLSARRVSSWTRAAARRSFSLANASSKDFPLANSSMCMRIAVGCCSSVTVPVAESALPPPGAVIPHLPNWAKTADGNKQLGTSTRVIKIAVRSNMAVAPFD